TIQQVARPPVVIDRRYSRHALFFVQSLLAEEGWRDSRREARARQGEASRKADAPPRLRLRCARRINACQEGNALPRVGKVMDDGKRAVNLFEQQHAR